MTSARGHRRTALLMAVVMDICGSVSEIKTSDDVTNARKQLP